MSEAPRQAPGLRPALLGIAVLALGSVAAGCEEDAGPVDVMDLSDKRDTGPGAPGDADASGPADPPRRDTGSPDPVPADAGSDAAEPPAPVIECGPGARTELCARGECRERRCVHRLPCQRTRDCLQDHFCDNATCRLVCAAHGDCPSPLECTDGLCQDRPAPECDDTHPCPDRRACHPSLQVCTELDACREDADCDITRFGARACDRVARRCAYCMSDDDCPPGRSCAHDPAAGESICAEPVVCADHGDCLPGRECDRRSGLCAFRDACAADDREPNDTLNEAEMMAQSHLAEARYTGLTLCSGNPDWYRVRVPPGKSVHATLRYLAPFDELDLAIHSAEPGAPPVALGEGVQNAKEAAVEGFDADGGFYYLEVSAARGGSNFYTLEVDLPECVDDRGEPDDTPEAARPLADSASGWICGPDADWFRYNAPADAVLVAQLLFPTGDADLRLVHSANPGDPEASNPGAAVQGGAMLTVGTGEGGAQWIGVVAERPDRVPYRLEVSLVGGADCLDDLREENDGRLSPAVLNPGRSVVPGLRACPGDPDWFAIPLAADDGIRIRALSEPPGVLTRVLHAPSRAQLPLQELAGPDPDGVIRLGHAARAGHHLLLVEADEEADYELEVEVVPGGFCVDDENEENDDPGQETPIRSGSYDLRLCPDDKDRFSMWLEAGSIVEATVEYDPESSALGLALYDPLFQVVAESGDGRGVEQVRARVEESGRHTFRVGRQQGEGETEYRLTVAEEPVNDSCEGAVRIEGGDLVRSSTARALDGLRGSCGGVGADVVYRLELDEPSGVELTLSPAPGSFPGVLHLRTRCDSRDTEVACVAEGDREGRRVMREPFLRGGTYFVVVDSADRGRSGNFDLAVRVVPGGICFEDDLEPNGGPDDAVLLPEGNHTLGLCPGDQDWFRVDVADGWDLAIRLDPLGDAEAIQIEVLGPGDDAPPLVAPVRAPADLLVPVDIAGEHLLVVTGGPGEYALRVASIDRRQPEDSCLDPPELRPGERTVGDTDQLHHFAGGSCGNPRWGPSEAPDAVYHFSLVRQSSIKATVTGEFDKVVYLRSRCDDEERELACVDDWIDPPEVLELPHLVAGDYYLFVDGFDDAAGPYDVSLLVREPFFPPVNDTCADAIGMVPGGQYTGSTQLAEDDYSSSCTRLRGHAAPDVVYTFHLDGPVRVVLSLDTQRDGEDFERFDSVLYVKSDCELGTQPIACRDDPEIIDDVLGEGDYFVFVDGWREGRGDFVLDFDVFPLE